MLAKIKNLLSHSGFRRYAANTSWLLSEKILRLFVGLFIGVWVTRYLGPENFGLFSYAQAFVGLFSIIAGLGLDSICVRYLVDEKEDRNTILGTAFILKTVGAIVMFAILAIAVLFTSNDHSTNVYIFIIASATIFQSFNVIDFYFQAKILGRYVVYANILSLLLSTIVKIILILNEAPLIAFVCTIAFDSIVLALGFIYCYFYNRLSIFQWRFNISLAKSLLRSSWPLVLSGIVISVYMRIDQIMIKSMIDENAVGQYAAAVRISEAWYFVPMIMNSSLFPAIINAKKKGVEIYHMRLEQLFTLMAWLGIGVALVTTFFSDFIINFLYGSAFHSGDILAIYIWAGIFVCLGTVSSGWFIIENLQIMSFYRTFIGMCLNIALNFLLIPKYGITGAALSTLITQIFVSYLWDVFSKKTRQLFYLKSKGLLGIGLFNLLKR